jgi:predicted PurR-regulated permease PerM
MTDRVKPSATKKRPEQTEASEDRKPLPLDAAARVKARVVLALVLVGLALWTAASFLPALIWATILAVSLWPLYLKFAKRSTLGPSNLAAFIFTLIVALILFTPMALAVYQVAQQGDLLIGWLKKAGESGIEVPEWIARLPVAAESMQQWWRDNLSDPKAATAWLKTVNAENASELFRTLGGQLLHRLFLLFFSLLTLFVLLSNGRSVANRFLETSDRLFGEAGEGLIEKMVDATRGTVNGTVLVAVGEGLWIGVGYLIAGVPNAAYSPFSRRLSLVGGWARLPFLLAFVGIFGGLAVFGLIGLFLGPVIMAALLTVWREWVFRPAVEQKAA